MIRSHLLPFTAALCLIAAGGCLPPVNAPDDGIFSLLRPASAGVAGVPVAVGPGYAVGGTIFGEVPVGMSVSISGGSGCGAAQSQSPVATGSYAFATNVPDGCAGATVAVTTQPADTFCVPYNTAVTVTAADVTNVDIYCFMVDAPTGALVAAEGAGTTANIRLTASPGPSPVTIDFASSVASAVTTTASLTFTGANYSTYQTVTLSALLDSDLASETATVAVTLAGHALGGFDVITLDTTPQPRFIYATAATHTGDFAGDGTLLGTGWIEKADNFCSAPTSGPPSPGNYRAVLAGTGRTGLVGAQANWPIRAGVPYYAADATTLIATAAANNVFAFDILNPLGGGDYWTGIINTATWATGTPAQTCSSWADGTVGSAGSFGTGAFPTGAFIAYSTNSCDTPIQLLCVQDARDMGDGTVSSAYQSLRWMKCSVGQTWNPGTNTCTGAVAHYQFCDDRDNDCNGAIPAGSLDGAGTGISQIYEQCDSLALAGRSWRVPTRNELLEFYRIYRDEPSVFPGTPAVYYWTNESIDTTSASVVDSANGNSATSFKDDAASTALRCVSTGL